MKYFWHCPTFWKVGFFTRPGYPEHGLSHKVKDAGIKALLTSFIAFLVKAIWNPY